jgi:hypothetical protein
VRVIAVVLQLKMTVAFAMAMDGHALKQQLIFHTAVMLM